MPLRVAICGLGSATMRAHLPAITRDREGIAVEVVGVCDRDAARVESTLPGLPTAAGFTDVELMLEKTGPDLLVIATPPSAHVSEIAAAASRAVHVLCEKPVGLSDGEVETLDAIRSTHPAVALVTVYQYRYAAAWSAIECAVEEAAERGEPFRLSVTVDRPGTDPLSADAWRAHPDTEGGIVGDHSVHYLDLCWNLDRKLRILDIERDDHPTRGTASVTLGVHSGEVAIRTSYAADRRRNSVVLERPGGRPALAWIDGDLDSGDSRRQVGALSDRHYVDDLYVRLYDEVFTNLADLKWRRARTDETVGVARLLASVLNGRRETEVPAPFLEWSGLVNDLVECARAVLLAFADLGVYLPSNRDRLIRKARGLDPLDPSELEEFLDLCIKADLIAPERAGRLRLAPFEAKRLARSLKGHTPVPDDQAMDWVQQLRAAPV